MYQGRRSGSKCDRQDKSSSAGHDGAQSVRERELIFRWNDSEGQALDMFKRGGEHESYESEGPSVQNATAQ